MKQNIKLKSLILAAAVSLGSPFALAQDANVAVPTPSVTTSSGLLGSRYTEVAYKFIDLKGSEDANGFAIGFNQPLSTGFDFVASYDWVEVDVGAFTAKVQDVEVGVKAFSELSWGKPFILAAVGWEWQRVAGFRDSSFVYRVGTGAEFQISPAFTLTPFVNYVRATSFNASEVELGAKATVRLNDAWSLTARAQHEFVRQGADSTEYSVGAIFRF